jgi:hypothetical protein
VLQRGLHSSELHASSLKKLEEGIVFGNFDWKASRMSVMFGFSTTSDLIGKRSSGDWGKCEIVINNLSECNQKIRDMSIGGCHVLMEYKTDSSGRRKRRSIISESWMTDSYSSLSSSK